MECDVFFWGKKNISKQPQESLAATGVTGACGSDPDAFGDVRREGFHSGARLAAFAVEHGVFAPFTGALRPVQPQACYAFTGQKMGVRRAHAVSDGRRLAQLAKPSDFDNTQSPTVPVNIGYPLDWKRTPNMTVRLEKSCSLGWVNHIKE